MEKKKNIKKENLGKYFLFGTISAVVLFIIFSLIREDDAVTDELVQRQWSPQMDSTFVKDCYSKYEPQVKDSVQLQETIKGFCRCMLEKIKTKYNEYDVDKMTDAEIKKWDAECRSQLLNPINIQLK